MKRHLGLLLLLSACDLAPPPLCADGQALAAGADGTYLCRDVPASAPLPRCTPPTEALGSAGGALSCQPRTRAPDGAPPATVLSVEDENTALAALLGGIPKAAPGGVLVGVTTGTSNGGVQWAASTPMIGIRASAAFCAAQFQDSHVCTPDEIYRTIATGRLPTADLPQNRVGPAWVYFPAWNDPLGIGQLPLAGLADTCGSFTYPLGARYWFGVTFSWAPLPTGVMGPRFHGGTDAHCSTKLPLACCR